MAGGLALLATAPAYAGGAGLALRFMGNGLGAPGLGRVEIALDPHVPADVGAGDFTVEWWLKALPGANTTSGTCTPGGYNWINGNIFLDRDVFGPGDWGDWGVSLWTGVIAFGVGGAIEQTVCGTSALDDGAWHHLAVTRRASDGRMELYVDGALEAQATGPAGDVSYRDGRATPWPKDPFLVLGTEKHDVQHTPFAGWLDELRLSAVLRYTANFHPAGGPLHPRRRDRRPLPLRRGLGHDDPRQLRRPRRPEPRRAPLRRRSAGAGLLERHPVSRGRVRGRV